MQNSSFGSCGVQPLSVHCLRTLFFSEQIEVFYHVRFKFFLFIFKSLIWLLSLSWLWKGLGERKKCAGQNPNTLSHPIKQRNIISSSYCQMAKYRDTQPLHIEKGFRIACIIACKL